MALTRRDVLRAAGAAALPYIWTSSVARPQDKNSRLRLGMIGCGGKGRDDASLAAEFGDFVALCDVDRSRAERFAANPVLNGDGKRELAIYGDHHIDIAQWALGALNTTPVEIEGTGVHDRRLNCFNTAQTYRGALRFANGTTLRFEDGGKSTNGILIEGDKERIFVNRGKLTGNLINKIVEDPNWHRKVRDMAAGLYDGPYGLPEVALTNYSGFGKSADSNWVRVKRSHMANFFKCIESGRAPISDVVSVGNATISCHLCNIALRLGRRLRWDPQSEAFIDDDDAKAMRARKQREGYEIRA